MTELLWAVVACSVYTVDDWKLDHDQDGDGYYGLAPGEGTREDCDDADASVYPGAPERCTDDVDSDCDGSSDESCDTIEIGCLGSEDVDLAQGLCWAQAKGYRAATVCAGVYESEGNGDFDEDCDYAYRGLILEPGFQLSGEEGVVVNGYVGLIGGDGIETTIEGITIAAADIDTEGSPTVRFEHVELDGVSFGEGEVYSFDSCDLASLTFGETGTIAVTISTILGDGISFESGVLKVSGSSFEGVSDGIRAREYYGNTIDVQVSNSTIELPGTGIDLEGDGRVLLDLEDVSIVGTGTAVYVVGQEARVDVRQSELSDNVAGSYGSAIDIHCPATLEMTDTVVHANAGGSGPLYFSDGVDATITRSTISGNDGDDGAFVFYDGSLRSDASDWGSGGDENEPVDIHMGSGEDYSFSGTASFSCDPDPGACY